MWREATGFALRSLLQQAGRVGVTRRALHRLGMLSHGAGVAFLRARRVLPDTAAGRAHVDRRKGSAMTPDELERELRTVSRTLRFVHLGEALEVLSRGRRLREGLAVLTFDESLACTVDLALPVCRALGVPFSVFVTTGLLDGARMLWDEEVHAVVDAVAPAPLSVSWIDSSLPTSSADDRAGTARRLLLSLASLDEAQLERRLGELFARCGGRPAVRAFDRMLSTDDVEQLTREPLVSFGAHGHRHLSLAAASDAALAEELATPRARLQQLCGSAFVDVVSYPFGRPPYVDDRVMRAARHAGYRAGFTAIPGVARPADHLFRLPRLGIGPTVSGVVGYELAGTLAAVDEMLLAASGDKARLVDGSPEG